MQKPMMQDEVLLGQLLLSLQSTTNLFGRNRGVNLTLYIEFGIMR